MLKRSHEIVSRRRVKVFTWRNVVSPRVPLVFKVTLTSRRPLLQGDPSSRLIRALSQGFRLYYPYSQYTQTFLYNFVDNFPSVPVNHCSLVILNFCLVHRTQTRGLWTPRTSLPIYVGVWNLSLKNVQVPYI